MSSSHDIVVEEQYLLKTGNRYICFYLSLHIEENGIWENILIVFFSTYLIIKMGRKQRRRSWWSWWWMFAWLILWIVLVLGWLFGWKHFGHLIPIETFWDVTSNNGENEWTDNERVLFVWKEVALSGKLLQQGDLTTHTHSLDHDVYGILWLKSRVVNLSEFDGNVLIGWKITDVRGEKYIVLVNTLVPLSSDDKTDNDENTEIDESWDTQDEQFTGTYIDAGAIYIQPLEALWYTVTVSESTKKVMIAKTDDPEQMIEISYFLCEAGNGTRDCAKQAETFEEAGIQDFINAYGNKFYKLFEVNSRYMTNENKYGYFISSDNPVLVKDVMRYVSFPSLQYLQKNLTSNVSTICANGNITLQAVDSLDTIINEQGHLVAVYLGKNYQQEEVRCAIQVNLASLLNGELQWIDLVNADDTELVDDDKNDEWEDTIDEKENEDEQENATEEDTDLPQEAIRTTRTDVEQFPINLEKPLEKTFNAWYTLVFPSQNIAFGSENIQTDLWLVWVNCYIQTNVIKFSDADQLDVTPTVSVYVCGIDDTEQNFGEDILYRTWSWSNKDFLIKVNDAARFDFAENLAIK